MHKWYAKEGNPHTSGVTWEEQDRSYNFALFSKEATAVTLLIYNDSDFVNPVCQLRLSHLTNKSQRIWHCRLQEQEVKDGKYYAYRVEGPWDPDKGQRFDDRKILLDPFAKAIFFPPAFSREAASLPGDNSGMAPLGLLPRPDTSFDWGEDKRPAHDSDAVIYEMHVRAFTFRENSGVAGENRGTFLGVIEKIPYLKELGVTIVELLPVFQGDPQDPENYWGYMPLNFFSPQYSYARTAFSEEVKNEFRSMVKALHENDIEVIIDVVYNHTTEIDETGPSYSYRGIDNSVYYLLSGDMKHYRNDSGTGNVMRCAHPYVRKLIMESMRYWVKEMHVDGFRFDLASIFARNNDGSLNLEDPAIISEISTDPDFQGLRLIAEVWDISSFLLGRSFPGTSWHQWNARFRDDVRSFIKGDPGKVGAMMSRIYGSCDLFPDDLPLSYHPYQSINYINCHDGFCLYDLVSYNEKHNLMNGRNNQDGMNDNASWNCGWEGNAGVPDEVMSLRRQQVKNFCTVLFLSNGIPMFTAGDEFLNTQQGNNNPFNQDNEITWLDWDLLKKNGDIFRFFRRMISFRKSHPSICRSRFWRDDISWYGTARKNVDLSFHSHCFAYCLHGGSEGDTDLYVMLNASREAVTFAIHEGSVGEWRRAIDTSLPSPGDICEAGEERPVCELLYPVQGRSVVVLVRRRDY